MSLRPPPFTKTAALCAAGKTSLVLFTASHYEIACNIVSVFFCSVKGGLPLVTYFLAFGNLLSVQTERRQRTAKGDALGRLRTACSSPTIAPLWTPRFYGGFSEKCIFLFPARGAGHGLCAHRARQTSPLLLTHNAVLLPMERLVRWMKRTGGKPSGGCIQKGARRPPMLVVFKGSFQRGGNRNPPLWRVFGYFLRGQKVPQKIYANIA